MCRKFKETILMTAAVLALSLPSLTPIHAAPATQQATTGPSASAVSDLIVKGTDALNSGDHRAARDAFIAAAAADGKNVKALHGLGLAYLNLGDLPKARDAL